MIFSKKTRQEKPAHSKLQIADGKRSLNKVLDYSGTRIFNNDLASAIGYALTGKRAAAFTNSDDYTVYELLQTYRSRNLALVIFHELSSTSDFLSSFDFGDDFIVIKPANAQELIDFGIIAQAVTEKALIPVVCLFDKTFCSGAIQNLHIPDKKSIKNFLGNDSDIIDSPTAAQGILFGTNRKRVPGIVNPDRPVGSGLLHDPDSELNQLAARKPYFKDHATDVLVEIFKTFAELSGRFYESIRLFNAEKADYLLVCSGPLSTNLVNYCVYAEEKLSVKLGIVTLPVIQPFDQATLSHIVKKKSGLTVLEDITSLNLHIYDNMKSAMNMAWENGRNADSKLPNPNYAIYSKPKDQPDISHGFYIQNINSAEKINALVKNMTNKTSARRHFYIGFDIDINQSRFPKLETLQQRIRQAYPKITELTLPADEGTKQPAKTMDQQKIELYVPVARDITEFSNLIAVDFVKSGTENIQMLVNEQRSAILPFNRLTWLYSKNKEQDIFHFAQTDIFILANMLFEDKIENIRESGVLLINSALSIETLWQRLSESNRQAIRRKKLHLYVVDAEKIAAGISVIPANREMLSLYVLYGALLKIDNYAKVTDVKKRLDNLKHVLQEQKLFESQILEIIKSAEQGFNDVAAVRWSEFPGFTGLKKPEEETPWTVKDVRKTDGSLYDLARSWDSVGYLYRTEQKQQLVTDPFLASNTVPARSSSFRDLAPITEKVPQLITEKCTGCGMCWSQCPDSALPTMITTTEDILKSTLDTLASRGQKLIQIQRIADNLAKQAYKLISTDELNRFLTAGSLFNEAFKYITQKMGLKDDQLKKVENEFNLILTEIADLPVIKTASFFDNPHNDVKGTGKILTINVNPAACKGCTSCMNVCPENALEMVESSNDVIDKYRKNFNFQNHLPETDPGFFINQNENDSLLNLLLHKKNYYTLSGGDNAFPGSGVKTTVHLVMAGIESVMNQRYNAFTEKIDVLIRQLEEKLQGRLQSSVQINEFEEFGQKLSQLEGKDLEVSDLVGLLEPKDPKKKLNTKHIKRLTEISQKLKSIKQEYIAAANGNGRARMVSVLNSSGLLYWCAGYPFNPFANPWINAKSSDLAASINGVFEGLTTTMAETFKWMHLAELELKDEYVEQEHETYFDNYSWEQFSAEEKALCPPALLLIDGSTLKDQNLGSIIALTHQQKPLYISVLNNMLKAASGQAHLNWTLNFSNHYILQSTAANPGHLLSGVVEMLSSMQPGIMHLYACEPHLQGLPEYEAHTHHKRAVNSRVFPIFKYNPQKSPYFTECFDLAGNPSPENDWISNPEKNHDNAFTSADWAIHEKEYRSDFHAISKGDITDYYLPLDEYLNLEKEKQKEYKPFITIRNAKDQVHFIGMTQKIVDMAISTLHNWLFLQELAGIKTHDRSYIEQQWQKKLEKEIEDQKQKLEAEFNGQLAHVQKEHWQIYQGRLRDKLKALHDIKNKDDSAEKTLAEYAKRKN